MNDAGVSFISRRTRDSAGWMRCCSASKSSPVPSAVNTTTSPSITNSSAGSVPTASTISGK